MSPLVEAGLVRHPSKPDDSANKGIDNLNNLIQ